MSETPLSRSLRPPPARPPRPTRWSRCPGGTGSPRWPAAWAPGPCCRCSSATAGPPRLAPAISGDAAGPQSAARPAAALSRPGQERHLPDDGGRAQPDGDASTPSRCSTSWPGSGCPRASARSRPSSPTSRRSRCSAASSASATAASRASPSPTPSPHLQKHADKLAVMRSCYHDAFNHSPAQYVLTTGMSRLGYPSVGRVGHLRPGLGVGQPAGDGRDDGARRQGEGRHALLGQRLPARDLPGRAHPDRAARRSST